MHPELIRWLHWLGAITVEASADHYDTDAAPLPEAAE
jgi:hypothetical protein